MPSNSLAVLAFSGLLGCVLTASLAIGKPRPASAATSDAPAYAKNGDLLPPANYREWVYLTTGMDMSYTAKSMDMGDHSTFDNIFVDPQAYRSFLDTGTWPDKTMIILEARGASSKGSINQHGHFQSGGVQDLEIHVKDEARFPGKWAFFSFDSSSGNGTLIPQGASCYTCHAAHAAVDTTFVQFYPTLLPIATKKGTLSPAYQKEEAAGASK
jgi:hypothetical protein